MTGPVHPPPPAAAVSPDGEGPDAGERALTPEELALRDAVLAKARRFMRAWTIAKIGLLALLAALLYRWARDGGPAG